MLRRAQLMLTLVATLAAFALPAPARSQDAPPPAAPTDRTDQIIVRYAEDAPLSPSAEAQTDTLSAAAGVSLDYLRAASGDAHVLQLPARLPVADVEAIAARLAASPFVAYAEPDLPVFIARTPNDSLFGQQWHYGPSASWGANLEAAWDLTIGDPDLVVAVIDTGVRPDHPDLVGRSVAGLGYDMVSSSAAGNDGNGRDADPSDPGDWVTSAESASGTFAGCTADASSWHGTHVAGTIGAASDNSIGVAGVNWRSRLLHVRALGKCGGVTSDLADAIRWAAGLPVVGAPPNPNPARVINLSLGSASGRPCGLALQDAISAAVGAGAVIVAAAGNASSTVAPPANCNNVIAVAATGASGQRASYSNTGLEVDLAAPGGAGAFPVLSTDNGGVQSPGASTYDVKQGTSMATPHVAGVASLVLSVDPTLTPAEVEALLKANVTLFPGGSGCTTSTCGAGILNAGLAVAGAGEAPELTSILPQSGVLGAAYSHTFSATGRPDPLFSISGGAAPPGLLLNPETGVLSGVPSALGSYSFTVRAANGVGADATQSVTVRINPTLGFSSQPPGAAIVGQLYEHRFTATGATTPTFRVASGQLPAGLTLNQSTGVLRGTPAGPGVIAELVIEATRGAETATQPVRLIVGQVPSITSAAPPSGQVSAPYSFQVAATGFPAPTFTAAEGEPPPGLTLSAETGELSGTPTAAGVFSFTLRASNGVGAAATQRVSIAVRSTFGDLPQVYLPQVVAEAEE